METKTKKEFDLLIGVTATENKLTLVTDNMKACPKICLEKQSMTKVM